MRGSLTNAEILMIVFTAVIAITGVVGALIFNNQLSIMQGQLGEMKTASEIAQTAADAAKDSAAAANAAVKQAADTAERQLRAYVLLDEKPIEFLRVAVNEEPSFMLRFKNYGLTPAYKMVAARAIANAPWPLPDEVDLTINPTVDGAQVLAPGSVTFWGSTPDGPKGGGVTADEMVDFQNGTRRIYIFGRLTYTDAFNVDRFTNFCLSVLPPTDPAASADIAVKRCARHNEAD